MAEKEGSLIALIADEVSFRSQELRHPSEKDVFFLAGDHVPSLYYYIPCSNGGTASIDWRVVWCQIGNALREGFVWFPTTSSANTIRRPQDTITGFLLAGVGHIDLRKRTNYLVTDAKTTAKDIEGAFRQDDST